MKTQQTTIATRLTKPWTHRKSRVPSGGGYLDTGDSPEGFMASAAVRLNREATLVTFREVKPVPKGKPKAQRRAR